jgi:short-subunit dehydrogenase
VAEPELRALVTGASSGIGRAYARALARRGEKLVLVARRADRLEALAAELGGAISVPIDLTAADAASGLEAELARRGIAVDMLVNDAGLGDTGRFHERPLAASLRMLDLNARALVELTRRFLPGMVARRRGRVVNVVSTSAFQPVPYLAVYAATKAFVLSFTEALADELRGTSVAVQALCPGLTTTEFQEVAHTDRVAFNRTRAMRPEDVVAASLKGLERGRLRVVPGWDNWLVAHLQGWAPRALVRRVAGELFRPSN